MDMLHRLAGSTIALLLAGTALAPPAGAQVQPTAPAGNGPQDGAAGHGSVAVVYTNTYENGIWDKPDHKVPWGTVHLQGLGLEASYNIANDWSIYGSVRYIDNLARQIDKPAQHVNSVQDATLGGAWRRNIGNYQITVSATATIPLRDYTTFGGAYAGQHLNQLLLGASLAHQFDFSDIYYRIEYGYAFSQKVHGFDTGYERFTGELGWFANDKLSVRAFLTGRGGFGLTGFEATQAINAGKLPATSRAQVTEHSYRAWGVGMDYDFGNNYLAGFSVQRDYWGASVFNARYALDARLTRSF